MFSSKTLLILLAIIFISHPLLRGQEAEDSIPSNYPNQESTVDTDNDYHFRYSQVIMPVTLTAIGSWGVNNGWLCKQKNKYQKSMQKLSGGHKTAIDNYVQYAPWAFQLALPYLGAKGKHPYKENVAATLSAFAVMNILVKGMKIGFHEKRPDTSAHNSFPSGHTATAFCGAELINIEFGKWYGVAAYISAIGVGFLRPYNNRHYINDVIAGAAIGVLSARAGYWLLPTERKLFGWDKKKDTAIAAIPYFNPENNNFGASISIAF